MIERFVKVGSQPRTPGLGDALREVWLEIKLKLLHGRGIRQSRKYRGQQGLKLHIGCGNNNKPGWVNSDMRRQADVMLDLRCPLPFDDDSCKMVYSEHFFEHLDHPGPAGRFLVECARVLEPGGVFSVVVPDTELVLKSSVLGGTDEYYAAQERHNPPWCETQVDHVNFIFRQHGMHRYCYDFETLEKLLARSGFTGVRRREFDPELDNERRIVGSLYVECVVPEPGAAATAPQVEQPESVAEIPG